MFLSSSIHQPPNPVAFPNLQPLHSTSPFPTSPESSILQLTAKTCCGGFGWPGAVQSLSCHEPLCVREDRGSEMTEPLVKGERESKTRNEKENLESFQQVLVCLHEPQHSPFTGKDLLATAWNGGAHSNESLITKLFYLIAFVWPR